MSTFCSGRGFSETSQPISLRGLLDEAVFVGTEDVRAGRCVNRAEHCRPGDVFIPLHDAVRDEHDRVEEAVSRGAVAVVAERILPTSLPQCLVESTGQVFGEVCQALAGNPSQRMLTIGVVGTHAKTTTSLYVSAMLKRLGGSVGYFTSLGASDSTSCDRLATARPDAAQLARWLAACDKAGAPAAVIEISADMIHGHALAGIEFDVLILTGLRPDQLQASHSGRRWNAALDSLSEHMKPHGMLLVNADDASAASWAEDADLPSLTYGLDAADHVRGKRLGRCGGEQQLLAIAGNLLMPLTLKTPGDHVARAALAAVATSWLFDLSVPDAIAGIESLESMPGRMQRIMQAVEVPIYIDRGQTPDRVATALHALRVHQLGETTVVMDLDDCLDPSWRQRLGEVLDKCCTRIVLTTSRLSDATARGMAMDVLGGVDAPGRVQVIPCRLEAIRWAVANTPSGCILLSGQGCRSWLDRNGQTQTDEQAAKTTLAERAQQPPMPALKIFPPSETTAIFPIDS